MSEFFLCDPSIFTEEPYLYLRDTNKDNIIDYLKKKHISEKADLIDADLKRSDLIIWNALLVKEITDTKITKNEMAKIYNYFYQKIILTRTLSQLQDLEVEMFIRYLNELVNLNETTEHLLVNKILHHIHINIENYTSLKTICTSLNISASYASAMFKEKMGVSLIKYTKQIKIERAKVLLHTTNESILSLSSKLGFHDQSHFCNTFKKFVGMTPIQFRNLKK